MIKLGIDEQKNSRTEKYIRQTDKSNHSDGIDVEFSEEYADHNDKVAQTRVKKAEERNQKK